MKDLSPAARAFLGERRFAVLCTLNPDGSPHQSVMWYDLAGDTILMNTKRGRRKERNLRRDPRCSICVENELRFVTVSGRVEMIDDRDTAQADIRRLAVRYNGEESAERQMREGFGREERVTLRLVPERIIERL